MVAAEVHSSPSSTIIQNMIPQGDILAHPSLDLPINPSSPQNIDGPTTRSCSMKYLGVRSTRYAGVLVGTHVTITVDCGSEGDFILNRVAERLGLVRVSLMEPYDVEFASGN